MRLYVDTANPTEIDEWAKHPWVSGFTTNPTLMRSWARTSGVEKTTDWVRVAVGAAAGKPISIDGPPEVWELGDNVWRKVAPDHEREFEKRYNTTAVCCVGQLDDLYLPHDENIVSVFAGRIMDTGRDPRPVIDAARATGAQVLWASVREPYNIRQAEDYGCDIVTCPPAILRKYLDWNNKPLEVVAAETIAQFDKDREGLW